MIEPSPFILASASKARQALLRNAQIDFEVIPANIDERAIQRESGLRDGGAIAEQLALVKALSVAGRNPGRTVIGADQTLSLGGELFNKPPDLAVAVKQLSALSGRTHYLHSAVVVVKDANVLYSNVAVAGMTMRALDDRTIAKYIDRAGNAATQSVGGYQLEGLGIRLFEQIEGDYFTILGLPLLPLLAFLRGTKLIEL